MDTNNVDVLLTKMQEMFGEALTDPDVYPRIFQYQYKLAKYELKTSEKPDES